MRPQEVRDLMYSPVFISDILYFFCKGARRVDERGVKFELIYLVIPFVMDDIFRRKLKSMNISSTFKTAFFNKNEELNERLFFINDKVKFSRNVTNEGLIYLSSICDVSIGAYFNILKYDRDFGSYSNVIDEYFKAASNLGSIFAKEGYINVFLKCKVKII